MLEYQFMELLIYRDILTKAGINPDKRTEDYHDYTCAQYQFRCDLANGRCVWYNNFYQDFQCFVRNNHSFISIFSSSRFHPYTVKERLVVLLSIIGISLGFFVSARKHVIENELFHNSRIPFSVLVLEILVTSMLSFWLDRWSISKHAVRLNDAKRNKLESRDAIGIWIIGTISLVTAMYSLYIIYWYGVPREHPSNNKENAQIFEALLEFFASIALSWVIDIGTLYAQFVILRKLELRRASKFAKLVYHDQNFDCGWFRKINIEMMDAMMKDKYSKFCKKRKRMYFVTFIEYEQWERSLTNQAFHKWKEPINLNSDEEVSVSNSETIIQVAIAKSNCNS